MGKLGPFQERERERERETIKMWNLATRSTNRLPSQEPFLLAYQEPRAKNQRLTSLNFFYRTINTHLRYNQNVTKNDGSIEIESCKRLFTAGTHPINAEIQHCQ